MKKVPSSGSTSMAVTESDLNVSGYTRCNFFALTRRFNSLGSADQFEGKVGSDVEVIGLHYRKPFPVYSFKYRHILF